MNCECGRVALRGRNICLSCFSKSDSAKNPSRQKHEEDDIQEASINASRMIFPQLGKLLFAVPNGGKRNVREAVRLKRQGVVPGISDIVLLKPNKEYSFLCLECKTSGGRQSEEQKEFQRQAECAGGKYSIFRSATEFVELLKEYLNN